MLTVWSSRSVYHLMMLSVWFSRSVYHLTMLAVPHLVATKGNIVNVSSVNGMRSVSFGSQLVCRRRVFQVLGMLRQVG